jgi:endo-1,3(4)-beta-glucanase
MVPVAAHTGFIRQQKFISQEWGTFFSNGRVDTINSGWKGAIYADYAYVNPKTTWGFFSQANFNSGTWLDGGASRTWYLALAAMMGGAS